MTIVINLFYVRQYLANTAENLHLSSGCTELRPSLRMISVRQSRLL